MFWDVYIYDNNRNRITRFNIFEHYGFLNRLKKLSLKADRVEFETQLRAELMFCFWSKAEWELVVELVDDERVFLIPWCGCRNPEEVKIDVTDSPDFDWLEFAKTYIEKQIFKTKAKVDVFDQIVFRWEDFSDYVWHNIQRCK